MLIEGRAAPGWFVKTSYEAVTGLERVAAFLGGITFVHPDSIIHIAIICALFERLLKNNFKICPDHTQNVSTEAYFQGHTMMSPACASPDTYKTAAVTKIPVPTNVNQVSTLICDLG